MPVTSKSHRPLSSGLRITSRNPSGVPSLALGEERDVSHDWSAPDANAEMYQGFLVTRNRVGVNMAWIPLVEGSDIQQLRHNTQRRWVATPEAETWSVWTATGNTRTVGLETEIEEQRTSSCGRTQTRWLPE